MFRQLENRVKEADLDHREVVRPALQLMMCVIGRVKAFNFSNTSEEQRRQQTLADGTEATKTLLRVWNSKVCVGKYFIKVSGM